MRQKDGGDVLVPLQAVEVKGVVRKIKRIYWENVLEKVYRWFDFPGASPNVNGCLTSPAKGPHRLYIGAHRHTWKNPRLSN